MAQFARPSADDNNPGAWVTQAEGTSNLYQTLDETVADDGDYIKTPSAPSSLVYVTLLSTIEDPVSSSGHVLRFRRAKNAAGGAQINITHQLREGYVNEGTPGTLIKEVVETDVGESFATTATTLSGAEADAITDYADLYVRVLATQV